MSDQAPQRGRGRDRPGRIPVITSRRARRAIPYGRRRPINQQIGQQAPQTQPQALDPPTQVVRPPLNPDQNAPGPQQQAQPNQGIPPTRVVSPSLQPDSNPRSPPPTGVARPNQPPFALMRPPLNQYQNAPGPQANQPQIPLWHVPVYLPPSAPGQQNIYSQIGLPSIPNLTNTFRHRYPQMYITLPQDLPQGTIINVFHPAGSAPIAITPPEDGLYTLFHMPANPPQILGEMVDPNPPAPAQPNPPAPAQPNPPAPVQPNPRAAPEPNPPASPEPNPPAAPESIDDDGLVSPYFSDQV